MLFVRFVNNLTSPSPLAHFIIAQTMAVKQKTWIIPSVPLQPSSNLQELSPTTSFGRTEPRPLQWYSQVCLKIINLTASHAEDTRISKDLPFLINLRPHPFRLGQHLHQI